MEFAQRLLGTLPDEENERKPQMTCGQESDDSVSTSGSAGEDGRSKGKGCSCLGQWISYCAVHRAPEALSHVHMRKPDASAEARLGRVNGFLENQTICATWLLRRLIGERETSHENAQAKDVRAGGGCHCNVLVSMKIFRHSGRLGQRGDL